MAWTTPGTATAGAVLTAAFWNTNVRDNTDALYQSQRRLATVTQANTYVVNQTALASAADVFASDLTFTADGTSTYRVEFYCASMECASTGFTSVYLVTGTGTDIAQIAQIHSSNGINRCPGSAVYDYTPSAGSISLNIRAIYTTAGNGQLYSQSSAFMPLRLSVYGPYLA